MIATRSGYRYSLELGGRIDYREGAALVASSKPQKWHLPAVAPKDSNEPTWDVWLDQAHVDGLTRCGVEAKFARLQLVPDALSDPVVMFQGWEREEKHDCFCYVANPESDYRSTTIQTPPPPNKVFLVPQSAIVMTPEPDFL